MRTAAVICEFNPFHNGHAYILRKLREEYGADYIIAIMSGNYVQRGEPAIFDKFLRTEAALKGDGDKGYADVVIELPTIYSTASAGSFAFGGVSLALLTDVADILGFGVEEGLSLDDIRRQAELKANLEQDGEANASVRESLSRGLSYPEAISSCLGNTAAQGFSYAPNNILATEYVYMLNRYDTGHSIEPVAIPRIGDGYSSTVASDAGYCSAQAIRKKLFEISAFCGSLRPTDSACLIAADSKAAGIHPTDCQNTDKPSACPAPTDGSSAAELDAFLRTYIPNNVLSVRAPKPISPDILSGLLSKALLDAKYRGKNLTEYSDVSREIADRLIKSADKPMSFTERIAFVKTRQYTYTRISRALLHIVLGIYGDTKTNPSINKAGSYIRLLGFRREAAPLLKQLKANTKVPVITKPADYVSLIADEAYYSGIIYSLTDGRSEYEHSPIIV